jgi:hypothetical protein
MRVVLQGGYDLVRRNATRVCDEYITEQCIHSKGADACMYEALQRQAAQSTEAAQRTRNILLAVLLPLAGEA